MDGDPLTNSLMGLFLIEVMGIFPDNSRQLLAIKDECIIQAFSAQAAHKPFTSTIRTWCPVWCSQFFDA